MAEEDDPRLEDAPELEDVSDWYDYIMDIDESELTDEAYAANSLTFVEGLQEDGYEAQEVEDILFYFAKRLHDTETTFVPKKGDGMYLSYQGLLADEGIIELDDNKGPVESS
jgi:hypothetical protein